MRKLEDLKSEEWQNYLDTMVKNSSFTQTITSGVDWKENGVEYTYIKENEKIKDYVPLYDVNLITKLYQDNVDITIPLNDLKEAYNEMDYTNTVLVEYFMEVSRLLKMNQNEKIQTKITEIKNKLKVIIS